MAGDRAGTEERLKQAAVRVWARHGFHGAPVTLIAEEAGANVSLINRYFGGKEGLLRRLLEEMVEDKQRGDLGYPPQPDLRGEVLEYLRFRYAEDMRRRDLVRIVVSEVVTNDRLREETLRSMTYAADENFRARLEALQRAGAIAPGADLTELFRQVSLFSFSCSLIEGIVLGLPAESTDGIMGRFATMVAATYAAGTTVG